MPDIRSDKTTATAYPPRTLYEQWSDQADQLDMPISCFIIRMVEAGRTNISMEEASSESIRDLLQQKSDLKQEIQRQRNRIQDLERQLQQTSQSEIVSFIAENPGARTPEITQHVADTVPGRVASYLDALEGNMIEQRETGYYPLETDE